MGRLCFAWFKVAVRIWALLFGVATVWLLSSFGELTRPEPGILSVAEVQQMRRSIKEGREGSLAKLAVLQESTAPPEPAAIPALEPSPDPAAPPESELLPELAAQSEPVALDGSVALPEPATTTTLERKPLRMCRPGRPRDVLGPLEDNAPRPSPQPGDREFASEGPPELPGTDAERLHGQLGLLPNGSCCRIAPRPLPVVGLTPEELREAYRGFCFNSRVSDSISVDRRQGDVRPPRCLERHLRYPCDLASASIVMVFHNEHFTTLVRSVHSVLNHSPAALLKEIILVDDASMPDELRFDMVHWRRLQDELVEYCRGLPKVRLVKLQERRGLMVARMEGAWRAAGEALVFLDSHIEVTPGWLEPLLARIRGDRRRVVVPSIDGIDPEDFRYEVYGLGILSFSWTLAQKPLERPQGDDVEPKRSSVMCGGLFAADRGFFLHLGGYDLDMRIYGGEEIEIGFRIWQCGGTLEHIPCSHVGHIFRSNRHWQGQVYEVPYQEVTRNKLRIANVWMDEFKNLVELASPKLPPDTPVGSLEVRHRLRRKLKCKPFLWFLENVAKEVVTPERGPERSSGVLTHVTTGGCVDITDSKPEVGSGVRARYCEQGRAAQVITMDARGRIRLGESGLCMSEGKDGPEFQSCSEAAGIWRWSSPLREVRGVGQLWLEGSDLCLVLPRDDSFPEYLPLRFQPCSMHGAEDQLWRWTIAN